MDPASEPAAPASPRPALRARIAALFEGIDGTTASVLVIATAVLLVSDYEGSTGFFSSAIRPHLHGHGPYMDVGPYFWWFGTSLLLYLLIPCALAGAVGEPKLGGLGFGLGDWKLGLAVSGLFLAVMIPIVAVASRFPAFRAQYPMSTEALRGRSVFFAYELAYMAYFVSWEFLFRGYLLQSLRPRIGGGAAVFVQMVPFALMHSGKPEAEAYGAIVAGIALGILALRTRSFWYGAGIHAVVALCMDLFAGWSRLR